GGSCMRLLGRQRRSRVCVAAVVLLGFVWIGCGPLLYSVRAGWGGYRVVRGGRPIVELLEDEKLDPRLRLQLETAVEIRSFAVDSLGLPDNGSFRRYRDLDRQFAVWTVVAAPEFSLEPRIWCFPVAGCVSYRGYFSPERAEQYGRTLRHRGFDVGVRGVSAFSTLGRFRDPILNTFIFRSPSLLAELMFHELAHQVAYVRDDTSFNEAFASFVAQQGVLAYLRQTRQPAELEVFRRSRQREQASMELLLASRERLAALYRSPLPDAEMRIRKQREFSGLEQRLAQQAGGGTRALNNADLAAIDAYSRRIPAFEALFRHSGEDFERFFARVRELAGLERTERDRRLVDLGEAVP
ncbi:MAG: aminopeptidase, partial [Acidobacteriota bacterium]|nr:aminopeptidase [Acidobacteriota bacterium]